MLSPFMHACGRPAVAAASRIAPVGLAHSLTVGTTSGGIRLLHSASPRQHNQPDWPLRSQEYFRQQSLEERQQDEAARAALLASMAAPLRVSHSHPGGAAELAAAAAGGPQHFSVFRYRNQQFKGMEDDLIMMNKVDAPIGEIIVVDDVLLMGGRDASLIGRPAIPGARVTLQVEEHTHTEKVIVFKKKRRKGYKKKQGYRDEVSMVRVVRVELPEGVEALTTVVSEGVEVNAPAPKLQEVPINPIAPPQIKLVTGPREPVKLISEETRLRLRAERQAKPYAERRAAAAAVRATATAGGVRSYSTLGRFRPSAFLTRLTSSAAFHTSTPLTTEETATVNPTNESTIDTLLRRELNASTLRIEDTSGGCGAFFRLLVVSPKFAGLSLVKQHRLVNQTLKPHIANLHGLTLTTYTEEQWNNTNK